MFYDRILPVYAELEEIRRELANAAGSRRYSIGTLPSMAHQYLPKILLALESGGTRIDVDIRETSRELEELLIQGELHAAVMELQPRSAEYWSVKLFEEPYDAVVYPGHRFSNLPSISIQEIAMEPLILNPPSCTTRILFSNLIEEYGMKPLIKTEVQYGDFILGFVAAEAGITFAPRMTAGQIKSKGLISVPIEDPQARRCISLVSLSSRIGKFLQPYFLPG